MTIYTLAGHLTGSMWWPYGAPAAVPVEYSWSASPTDRHAGWSLRDVVDHISTESGGDFSDAAMLTADSVLIVTRTGPHGQQHTHYREVSTLPSIADFVSGAFGADFYSDEDYPTADECPYAGTTADECSRSASAQ